MAATLKDELKQLRASGVMPTPAPNGAQAPVSQQGQAPAGQSQADWIKQALSDLGTGVAKGAGETAVNLGKAVHATPVIGSITDALAKLVGPEGTDPNQAFGQSTDQMGLGSDNGMQSTGKFVEQLAEMLGAAPMAAEGAASATFKALPKGLPGELAALMTHTAAPALGQGVAAGANAMLHGDQRPGEAAGIAAAGPVVGTAAAELAPFLKNKNIQAILSFIAGIAGSHVAGGLTTDAGAGAGLGAFGLTRMLSRQLMNKPGAVDTVQKVARRGIPKLATTAATVDSQARR